MAERVIDLQFLEEKEALNYHVGCTPGEVIRQVLEIKEVKGLTVVDLASGASSLTSQLLKEGANAHGVDVIYDEDPSIIEFKTENIFYELAQRSHPSFRRNMVHQGISAIREFVGSMKTNPENYHRAFITDLPFADNYSDLTISYNGISELTDSTDLMLKMFQEALRITRRGGKIKIAPIHTLGDETYDMLAAQHAEVIHTLKDQGLKVEMETGIEVKSEIPFPTFTRLTITKS